jgi:CheY-like chemotaxis protein
MQMPVMDGLEATRLIRAWEQEQGRSPLYIVALTANAMPADERRCRDVGMNAYLSKPIQRAAFDVLLQQMQAKDSVSTGFSWKNGDG